MASLKDIKRRIKSVESTMQITKAMQLVASSKLRRSKEKTERAVPFSETLYETMREIVAGDTAFNSIFMQKRESKRTLLISIAGDRGLAGGFNSNIFKLTVQRCEELTADGAEVFILPIGRKAFEFFEKRGYKLLANHSGIGENISIHKSLEISDKVTEAFLRKSIDRVELVYTTFVSPLVQTPKTMELLPLGDIDGSGVVKALTTYEPSPEEVFDALIPDYIAGILYSAISDSYTAELAARRMAMENATDNAADMIDSLSLIYNRVRQSTITQEITEIVSGAGAV